MYYDGTWTALVRGLLEYSRVHGACSRVLWAGECDLLEQLTTSLCFVEGLLHANLRLLCSASVACLSLAPSPQRVEARMPSQGLKDWHPDPEFCCCVEGSHQS